MNEKLFQIAFYYYRLLHPTVKVTARLPLAQAKLESANWTSHVYQTNNNMFGMMAPAARNTTALNKGKGGYAQYSSSLDSISDYLYWLEAMGLLTDAALDAHIKAGKYAADKSYYPKVVAIANQLNAKGGYINPAAITAGAAAAGIAVVAGAAWTFNELTD